MSEDRAHAFVAGKFLRVAGEKLYVKGVTYGTFRPDGYGIQFPSRFSVARDFALMAANEINAVRTYTVPPMWLLDEAIDHDIRVMVGIPVSGEVAGLAEANGAPDPTGVVRDAVRSSAGHPAVLGYTIGNEIPAGTVRWHGRHRVERFLRRLYQAAKGESPDAIVTYANYPSTEYLDLNFLDVVLFNVFLESPRNLASYLSRLQNIAGDRPLLLGEMGLDSMRHGEEKQAESVGRQLRTLFSAGCAGGFIFSWTDEWYRGGTDIDDWRFGLTRTDRSAKPALEVTRHVFADLPLPSDEYRPKISVVVCSLNGAERIGECLAGISHMKYPDFETIVVDNGSSDDTATIADSYPRVRVIRTARTGLGDARNVGFEAAAGEIVAYLDDDAAPDPHWLTYLADAFRSREFAAVGGPNIAPVNGSLVSRCVGRAPGNPVHVLLSDREAEHIAGCNMAFKKDTLLAVGGFDPVYRVAGDDVDICWRLREQGFKLGFSHGAMVWHHPRKGVRAFWRQQTGYGEAEMLLRERWPAKYNGAGQTRWAGRVYGVSIGSLLQPSGRVYHGVWGTAPFQGIYQREAGKLASLTSSPEWYLIIALLGVISLLSVVWWPLIFALPLFGLSAGLAVAQAVKSASRGPMDSSWSTRLQRARARSLIALLHLLQPMARLWGRIRPGTGPEPGGRRHPMALPRVLSVSRWRETWRAGEQWVRDIELELKDRCVPTKRGEEFDRFDLEVRLGAAGSARLLVGVEDHAGDRQLVRTRVWPRLSLPWAVALVVSATLATAAALASALWAAVLFGASALLLAARAGWECACAVGSTVAAVTAVVSEPGPPDGS